MKPELRKVTAQIMSLLRKVEPEDVEYALETLVGARDSIISVIRDNGGVIAAGEECPPVNPNCDPPENPPPGP